MIYQELSTQESVPNEQDSQVTNSKTTIFISHSSRDKEVADMLVDFLSGTGIAKEMIFCSSLPGNDVNGKISAEIKNALKESTVDIAILSNDYYQSAYCLNEAGVLWFKDCGDSVIVIALPEINAGNMQGFLNSEYKYHRLDSDTDVSAIYDAVTKRITIPSQTQRTITNENNKLRSRYLEFLNRRSLTSSVSAVSISTDISEITTDDERIVLYYMLQRNIRKASKKEVVDWLNESEVYGVNVENAFDLLASFGGGMCSDDTLELGLTTFRKYSQSAEKVRLELKGYVEKHTKLSIETFKTIWNSSARDTAFELFIAYIVDKKVSTFGARWMMDSQIKCIEQWENDNILHPILSKQYETCLNCFIFNNLVYASGWTSYGNTREYTLCPSLRVHLHNCPAEMKNILGNVKSDNMLF